MVREPSEQLALGLEPPAVSASQIAAPTGYSGLAAFHKYWGKKPTECLGFLIDRLTSKGDLVVDPFVGSGLVARECASRGRRFLGIDINPCAIELARLLCDLPPLEHYTGAIEKLERTIRSTIYESYRIEDGRTATHYLWDASSLKEIWVTGNGHRSREVFVPSESDIALAHSYEGYASRCMRPLHFFQNARINTNPLLGVADLFTGRALRNIDVLLEHISAHSGALRRALQLTLTASAGQMSNMVFAITRRGKTKGKASGKTEVGSWVIGYWRPPLHFEINVWNCFRRRARKLEKALSDLGTPRSFRPARVVSEVLEGNATVALLKADAIESLQEIPGGSVKLVLTDPPHGDRIPYLELSELWNSILGLESDFSREIVVSNARDRSKTKGVYTRQMDTVLREVERVLSPNGMLAILFNARDKQSWDSLTTLQQHGGLRFCGCFPMSYSASSVVQDNRRGAMKSDYVLLYVKHSTNGCGAVSEEDLQRIPGWSSEFPRKRSV